jgi:hypothetical protein
MTSVLERFGNSLDACDYAIDLTAQLRAGGRSMSDNLASLRFTSATWGLQLRVGVLPEIHKVQILPHCVFLVAVLFVQLTAAYRRC